MSPGVCSQHHLALFSTSADGQYQSHWLWLCVFASGPVNRARYRADGRRHIALMSPTIWRQVFRSYVRSNNRSAFAHKQSRGVSPLPACRDCHDDIRLLRFALRRLRCRHQTPSNAATMPSCSISRTCPEASTCIRAPAQTALLQALPREFAGKMTVLGGSIQQGPARKFDAAPIGP